MEFSRETFVAFSDALSSLYYKSDRDERITSLTGALRHVFHGCKVETSTGADDATISSGAAGLLSLAVPGTQTKLVISNANGLGPREQFLAQQIRLHLENNFGPAKHRPSQPAGPTDARRARALGLTPRECEVLHWLMIGKRDAEIAAQIGAAPRTVNKHVENILRKLGVETRGGAAHVAAERLPRIPDAR